MSVYRLIVRYENNTYPIIVRHGIFHDGMLISPFLTINVIKSVYKLFSDALGIEPVSDDKIYVNYFEIQHLQKFAHVKLYDKMRDNRNEKFESAITDDRLFEHLEEVVPPRVLRVLATKVHSILNNDGYSLLIGDEDLMYICKYDENMYNEYNDINGDDDGHQLVMTPDYMNLCDFEAWYDAVIKRNEEQLF